MYVPYVVQIHVGCLLHERTLEIRKMNQKERKSTMRGCMRRVAGHLSFVSIVLVLLCCIAVLSASAAEISIVPSLQTVSKGENFTVDIYVDPEGNGTGGVDYILCFNNTLLRAVSLESGTFFSGFTTDDTYGEGINNTTGTVDYCELIWPVTGNGVTTPNNITSITFQAIVDSGDDVLYFKKVTLGDPDGIRIPTNTSNGSVEIVGICGDVDGKNGVTMFDGRQIWMNLIYGAEDYPIANQWAADVDCKNGITMFDGRQIWMNLIYGEEDYPLGGC